MHEGERDGFCYCRAIIIKKKDSHYQYTREYTLPKYLVPLQNCFAWLAALMKKMNLD